MEVPLDQMLLQIKAIGVDDVMRFPFVSSPNTSLIKKSLRDLLIIGALESWVNAENEQQQMEIDRILGSDAEKDESKIT